MIRDYVDYEYHTKVMFTAKMENMYISMAIHGYILRLLMLLEGVIALLLLLLPQYHFGPVVIVIALVFVLVPLCCF